jgi:hypothetical protein
MTDDERTLSEPQRPWKDLQAWVQARGLALGQLSWRDLLEHLAEPREDHPATGGGRRWLLRRLEVLGE